MPFPDPIARRLLAIARASIRHGLDHGRALRVELEQEPPELRPVRATFVTLRQQGTLRGCIGTLEARDPLAQDVATHAYEAAFEDPRFEPLQAGEFDLLHLHISILSPSEPLPCRDEEELLARLRPGVDGLILQDGAHRATFLPAVWDDLQEPEAFLAHLKMKAGLPAHHWSAALRFWRYRAECVEDPPV